MMEGRREGMTEDMKEIRMELRVMREKLSAIRRNLEKIETILKRRIVGTREERMVRRGMEKYEGEVGGGKEETLRKLEIKESRRKEEKRKEDGWRIVADPETRGEMWEKDSVEERRGKRGE